MVRLVTDIGPDTDWDTKEKRQLVDAVLALKSADETKRFLRDLLTIDEIEEFAARLEAARLLSRDVQYNAITESTGLSSKTIARIQKWLQGSLGGYRLVLSRLPGTASRPKLGASHHSNSSQLRKGLSLNS